MGMMHNIRFSSALVHRARVHDCGARERVAQTETRRYRYPRWKTLLSILLVVGCIAFGLALPAEPVKAHQPHDPVVAIGVSPAYSVDQTIFLATGLTTVTLGVHAVLKSSDGGVTWTVVSDLPSRQVRALAVSPDYLQDRTVFAATLGGGLYRTTDGGQSWMSAGSEVGQLVVDVALSPSYGEDSTLFAINTNNGIFKSASRGESWTELPSPEALNSDVTVIALSPNYAADQTLLLASGLTSTLTIA